eukprot:CAMPEP_0177755186 /NCGR_PEP_ID=MMETSP0491_2-20121128/2428_1 /TAXON_ID=63592 /ORGANISM="Tetraselmis chuii, Strain PLY429" /LENGTH=224 /DNA_ID=CAMNT_0019270659 /DNA_START=178 /DNA_END=849 /DNA_ORIENTATION=+
MARARGEATPSSAGGSKRGYGKQESAALLQDYVAGAVKEKSKRGVSGPYNTLVEQVRSLSGQVAGSGGGGEGEGGAVQSLTALLSALTAGCAALSPRLHEALVSALFSLPLWPLPPPPRAALLDLLANLVATSGEFVPLVLEKLVGSLLPPPPTPHTAQAGPWAMDARVGAVQRDVVCGLERVLGLVPTAPGRLVALLAAALPHKLRDRDAHAMYLSALFALAE